MSAAFYYCLIKSIFIYSRVWFVVDTIKGTHVHCMISIVTVPRGWALGKCFSL